MTDEEERYLFAVGIESDKIEEEDTIIKLAAGIEKVKNICDNRNIENICFVVHDTWQAQKIRKLIEYVYRHESDEQVYYMSLNKAKDKVPLKSGAPNQEPRKEIRKDESVQRKSIPIETIRVELQCKGDVLAIKETGRKLQQNIDIDSLGVHVKSMQIEGEALLIRVKPRKENAGAVFCDAIKNHIQEQGKVQLITKMKTVVIREVDAITTESEISDAVVAALGTAASAIGIRSTKSRSTKQTVFVTLPELQARTLLETGRVAVGWARYKIYEYLTPDKCYQCQRYGHKSDQCKSETSDMRDKCLKCCNGGHIARECKSTPKCYQCSEEGHSAGSMNCPVYRKLVENLRGDPQHRRNTQAK